MQKSLLLILAVILILPSCLVSKKKYDTLNSKNQKSLDSLEYALDKTLFDYKNTKTKNNALLQLNKKLIDSLFTQTWKLSNDTSELSKSLKEKQKKLVQLENMINKNKAEVNKLKNIINEALKSFDDSELNIYLKDGKVYVAMEEKLLFKTGSSAIDKRGKEAIIKLGKILEKNTATEILIEGHTDNVGPDKYNWKLSTERALSVVEILTGNTTIKSDRITASGRGMHKPVASNATDAGKQKNRRIEIILVPKLDSLYKIMNE